MLLLNASSQLLDEWRAVVAIGHNYDAVSFHAMRDHVALKSPVAPSVHEIPAFTQLADLESNGVRPDANRSNHLLHRGLRQNAVRLAKQRLLRFDQKLRQIGRCRPKPGRCLLR